MSPKDQEEFLDIVIKHYKQQAQEDAEAKEAIGYDDMT